MCVLPVLDEEIPQRLQCDLVHLGRSGAREVGVAGQKSGPSFEGPICLGSLWLGECIAVPNSEVDYDKLAGGGWFRLP